MRGLLLSLSLLLTLGSVLWLLACRGTSPREPTPFSAVRASDFHSIAISPANPDLVLFGHHFGLMKSTDGGRTWIPLPGVQGDAMTIRFVPQNPATIYVAGHDIFLKSLDGGKSWQPVKNDLPGLDIHAFALHPNDLKVMYAFVVGFGLYKSEDSGDTWHLLNNALPSTTIALAVIPGEPEMIYAGSAREELLRSNDKGKTWRPVGGAPKGRPIFSLAYEGRAGKLYAGTNQGLFYTSDGGENWIQTSLREGNILAIALDPSRPGGVVALDSQGQIFKSTDGGQNWLNR